ncbi:MAG: hypothetical protein GYB66_06510 [Chloroflexi bacterium]|nr:hypothetical protein [Chloroflexota bacterium]
MGYMIGVDGGATGTVAILCDEDGTILGSAEADASNYLSEGKDNARQALHEVIHEVTQKVGVALEDCHVAVFGLAGLNHEAQKAVYQELIDPIGLGGKHFIENDIVIAWAGATACEPGVVVIAGTGSSAFGVNAAGERCKTLGWDYILADQGSGYWVGLEGIRTAFKAWDGRIPPTPLLDAMVDHYELRGAEEMLQMAHQEGFGKSEIAGFARHVSRCADAGDPVSQMILKNAGEELGDAVCAVIRQLDLADKSFTIGKIGGTFRAGDFLIEPFTRKVLEMAPNAQIGHARYPSVIGAVIYAHFQNGTLTQQVLDELERTSERAARWKT